MFIPEQILTELSYSLCPQNFLYPIAPRKLVPADHGVRTDASVEQSEIPPVGDDVAQALGEAK